MKFTDIATFLRRWVVENRFGFELCCVEVNPIIFDSIQVTIKKELLQDSIGDMNIILIDGLSIKKSSDPMSGIHFKFKDREITDDSHSPL